MIINSGNDYIAALKGNQPSLFKDVKTNFTPEFPYEAINKGHDRIENQLNNTSLHLIYQRLLRFKQ